MSWRHQAQRLRTVPLDAVLRISGAQPDLHDPHKWHTQLGVLSVTGAKFMNWSRGFGGGGAIDLVMHLQETGFTRALEWLKSHFPTSTLSPLSAPPPRLELRLPVPVPQNLTRMRRYLVDQRKLPSTLLDPLVQSGALYADAHANAVFLLRDQHSQPVGAELRGTTQSAWRGMAPGSRKDLGFFSIASTSWEAIVLCESAIDAISCHALHPHYRCLSTAGARPDPLWLSSLIAQGMPIFCGFDTDPTGQAMAHALIRLHPSVARLTPSLHDWNDVLRLPS